MLLSGVLATALSFVPHAQPRAQAILRITRAVRVTEGEWQCDRSAQKREIVIMENGQPLRLRLIEFE